jgi:hypothetical protein
MFLFRAAMPPRHAETAPGVPAVALSSRHFFTWVRHRGLEEPVTVETQQPYGHSPIPVDH